MKIGFLPLYIALYDESGFAARHRLEPFYETLAKALEEKGFEVLRSPFCRVEEEFRNAVSSFEKEGAEAVVTWHAAYSPSLESARVLAGTELPLVILDTTETFDFSPRQNPEEINFCHGIHGVMDLGNLLRRLGKPFAIAAGHFPSSPVIDRVSEYLAAAKAAKGMRGMRVGLVGRSFPGMGDFLIDDGTLFDRFGVTVVRAGGEKLRAFKDAVTEDEISREVSRDLHDSIKLVPYSETAHRLTAKNGLAVRRWLEEEGLGAFTASFLDITPALGLDVMPFMEACRAMERGIGYAGEGDVMTAALTGALLKGFPGKVSFVEIFCPDWAHDTLFLSHMGEMNYALADGEKELKTMDFIYGEASDPVVGYARYRAGRAVFVNLFPKKDGFGLLLSPVEMEAPAGEDRFAGNVRGWMKPAVPVAEFLEKLTRAGATHHSALVYDVSPEALSHFGELLGLDVVRI